jgi:membrane-associated phospholipid phosphatase
VMPGMTDTLEAGHILGAAPNAHGVFGLVNNYASMPSLHVAWAVWCAAAIVIATRTRWRHLAWLYPVLTTAVVLGTANHYLLDVIAGAIVAIAGLAVCRLHVATARRLSGRTQTAAG